VVVVLNGAPWLGSAGKLQATYQPDAPDEDHSPAMWSSMAATSRNDPNVILAPWRETTTGWQCFMQTGCDDEATYGPNNDYYQTAPMQQAVDVMRTAGYNGVISLPCIDYANMCGTLPNRTPYNGSTWLESRPSDPNNLMIAKAHVYGKNVCDTDACFDSSMRPIAKVVPMIFGETWADAHGVGYEAWTWDTWGGCGVLIANYGKGTPSSTWSRWVKKHYLAR